MTAFPDMLGALYGAAELAAPCNAPYYAPSYASTSGRSERVPQSRLNLSWITQPAANRAVEVEQQ